MSNVSATFDRALEAHLRALIEGALRSIARKVLLKKIELQINFFASLKFRRILYSKYVVVYDYAFS